MKVWNRAGVRVKFEGDEMVVLIDAAALVDYDGIDTPEVEVLRISKSDASAEWKRFLKNAKAELARFNERRTSKPKKGAKRVPK